MAQMNINKRMVYWKILIDNDDVTPHLSECLSKISIKYSVLPKRKTKGRSKKETKPDAPGELKLSITSQNYIEDWFLPGRTIDVRIAYDPVKLTEESRVFYGRLWKLPAGKAQELLDYTVTAYSIEYDMAQKEERRTFNNTPSKSAIVSLLARFNGFDTEISIKDKGVIKAQYIPIQRQETDLDFLERCAKQWNCLMWFTYPKTLHFVDAEDAHKYGKNLIVGYKNDRPYAENIVQSVEWSHDRPRAALEINPGLFGFNEEGKVTGKYEFEWVTKDDRAVTYRLKGEFIKLIKEGKGTPLLWANNITQEAIRNDIFSGINLYFEEVKYADNTSSGVPPKHADSGWSIKLKLNEGDPTFFPPRNIWLYSGSLNPRADGSDLPNFLKEYTSISPGVIILKANEHVLTYDMNLLQSEIHCTRGMFV